MSTMMATFAVTTVIIGTSAMFFTFTKHVIVPFN